MNYLSSFNVRGGTPQESFLFGKGIEKIFFEGHNILWKKNRIRRFVIRNRITNSKRTSELCSLSQVFIGAFSR